MNVNTQVITPTIKCPGKSDVILPSFNANQTPCIPIKICRDCKLFLNWSFPHLGPYRYPSGDINTVRLYYENAYNLPMKIEGNLFVGLGGHWLNGAIDHNHPHQDEWIDFECTNFSYVTHIVYNIDHDPILPPPGFVYPPVGWLTLSNLCITVMDCNNLPDCETCCIDLNAAVDNNIVSINQSIATFKSLPGNGYVPLNYNVFSNTLCPGEYIIKCFGSTTGGPGTDVNISCKEWETGQILPLGLVPKQICFRIPACGCERCFSLE